MECYKVLLLKEPDYQTVEQLIPAVNFTCEWSVSESIAEAKQYISQNSPSLIIVDDFFSTEEVFRLVAEVDNVPIILLATLEHEAHVVTAIELGIFDYLIKGPYKSYLKILPAVIERAIKYKTELDKERMTRLERSMAGVMEVNQSGWLVNCNAVLAQILGYDSVETLLTPPRPPIYHSYRHWQELNELLEAHHCLTNFELTLRNQAGDPVYVVMNVALLDLSEPPIIEATLIDLTERKQIENSLEEAQRFLWATLNALSSQVAILDDQGTIIAVNQEWRDFIVQSDFVGLERYGVGMNYLDLFRSASNYLMGVTRSLEQGVREVLTKQKEQFYIEYPYHRLTGRRWYSLRVTRFRGEGPLHIVLAQEDITERKQTEQQLTTSETNFRTIFEDAPLGMAIIDANYRFVKANRKLSQLVGYTNKELIQRTFVDITDPRDVYESIALAEQLFRGGRPYYRLEKRYITKHKQSIWLHVTVAALPNHNENPTHGMAMFEDVTTRKLNDQLTRIQRDLGLTLSSTSRLEDLLNSILDATLKIDCIDCGGIYLADENGALRLANHRKLPSNFVERVNYYPADSPLALLVMVGHPIYGHSSTFVKTNELDDEIILKGLAIIPVRFERRVVAALTVASLTMDEILHTTRSALEALALPIGGVIARVRAEEAHRESEARFRAIFEDAPLGITIINANYQYTKVNKRFYQMTEYKAADIENGLTIADLTHPDDLAVAVGIMQQLFSGEISHFQHEKRYLTKNNHIIWVYFTVSTFSSVNGQPELVLGMVEDISERKLTENSLHQNQQLLQMTNKSLRQTKGKLENLLFEQDQLARKPGKLQD